MKKHNINTTEYQGNKLDLDIIKMVEDNGNIYDVNKEHKLFVISKDEFFDYMVNEGELGKYGEDCNDKRLNDLFDDYEGIHLSYVSKQEWSTTLEYLIKELGHNYDDMFFNFEKDFEWWMEDDCMKVIDKIQQEFGDDFEYDEVYDHENYVEVGYIMMKDNDFLFKRIFINIDGTIQIRKVTDNSNNTNLYIPDCDRGERYFNLNKVIKEEQEINNRLINLNKTL